MKYLVIALGGLFLNSCATDQVKPSEGDLIKREVKREKRESLRYLDRKAYGIQVELDVLKMKIQDSKTKKAKKDQRLNSIHQLEYQLQDFEYHLKKSENQSFQDWSSDRNDLYVSWSKIQKDFGSLQKKIPIKTSSQCMVKNVDICSLKKQEEVDQNSDIFNRELGI